MQNLEDWVFSSRKIMTSNLLAALSNLSFEDSCKILYSFYQQRKQSLSTYFFVFLKNQVGTNMQIDRISEKTLLERLTNSVYKESILNVKVWAIYDKNSAAISIEDIYNAESYEANNKDNIFFKLRSIEPENKMQNLMSQHFIKISQNTQSQIAETQPKTYFGKLGSQLLAKRGSDHAIKEVEIGDEVQSLPPDKSKRRKANEAEMELEIKPVLKKNKASSNKGSIAKTFEDESF